MRSTFGKTVTELAKKDKKIVVLVGDISFSINNDFDKNEELLKTRNIVCYIGIFLAFLAKFLWLKAVWP